MVRTVNGEAVVWLCGGGRALLLQVAHPLVAAAVLEHSRFRTDPIGRLRDTLAVSFAYLFADAAHAEAAVASVTRGHARVRGRLPSAVGPYPASAPYDALDPALLLWVYATSVDSWLVAYEQFVRPLSALEREAYWAEARRPAPLWGIPPEQLPPDLAGLRAWIDARITGGDVVVGPQARVLARAIFRPPVRWLPWPILAPLQLVTAWLLPPPIRRGYGYAWGPRREAFMRRLAAGSRWLLPHLPALLREVPGARGAT
jgi:uncharacterized protein (DUF2236 family)